MTAREALREGAAALEGSETPFLDASLLLAGALGVDRSRLLASGPDELGLPALAAYRLSLHRRAGGLPVAYILGCKEFWGRRFAVDPRVLVPRADTETLVEAALRYGDAGAKRKATTEGNATTEARGKEEIMEGKKGEERRKGLSSFNFLSLSSHYSSRPSSLSSLRLHDVCTGSGCVAVSIAAERPDWEVSASDISEAALEVASANASALLDPARPGGKLALWRGDLLAGLVEKRGGVDLVVANPPYVSSAETGALLAKGWSEPPLALDGGEDGLALARRLVSEAALALAPGGALLMEADGSQAESLAKAFEAAGFVEVKSIADLGGRARVTAGRLPWTA